MIGLIEVVYSRTTDKTQAFILHMFFKYFMIIDEDIFILKSNLLNKTLLW